MNKRRKHIIASRLLLSVFVPMLLLMSLHVHPGNAHQTDTECYECANHLAHGGHLTAVHQHLHDCVLCQLMTVSYVAAVVMVLVRPLAICHQFSTRWLQALCLRSVSTRKSRAPPVSCY